MQVVQNSKQLCLRQVTEYAEGHNQADKKAEQLQRLTLTDTKLPMVFSLKPFESLKQLWLNRNKIQSIENLTKMKLEKLTKIAFSSNLICTMQSHRKIWFPKLIQLQLGIKLSQHDLDGNYIKQSDKFTQTLMQDNTAIGQVKIWVNFGNQDIEKTYISKEINTKFMPKRFKMQE